MIIDRELISICHDPGLLFPFLFLGETSLQDLLGFSDLPSTSVLFTSVQYRVFVSTCENEEAKLNPR